MKKLKDKYKVAKEAKVGEECICPSCGSKFTKSNYQQAFCKARSGTKCKDYYWNNVTETKRCNTTRISPTNRAWMISKEDKREARESSIHYWEDGFHPQDPYSLGQWD